MGTEKITYSSDTLERSNLSSLQSDFSSINKSANSDNNLNKTENSNFDSSQHFPQCLCERFQLNEPNFKKQEDNGTQTNEWEHFNGKWPRQSYSNKKDKSYAVKSKRRRKIRVGRLSDCCRLLKGIPAKKEPSLKNIENPMNSESNFKSDKEIAEKIEIYYFDHGNSAYYHTTDSPPVLATEKLAEAANIEITRFWAEIFGYIHVATSFITTLILQFIRCILFSLVRPLTVGIIQLVADYFLKPLLSITFNGIIQPILILFYNIATSLRDCCEPLATALGFYIKELAILFRSCRLIEVTHNHRTIDNT